MEIEFRGKIKGGDWNYGFYVVQSGVHGILTDGEIEGCDLLFVEVDPASVGMFTWRKDRNNIKIFSDDICKLSYGIPPKTDTVVIEWADDKETVGGLAVSGWWMRNIRKGGVSGSLCKIYEPDLEIIGNVTDNPELLEVK